MYSAYDHLAVGLPHSDIRGSTIARISPRLFAACYVLHRLLVPRHPPNALQRLISTFPRNHPGPCGSGWPISLLTPRQPRQPPRDARTHNSVPARPSTGIPVIGPPSRSPDAQFSFKHSTLSQKPASSPRRSGPKPHPAQNPTAAFKSKASVPSSPCQTAQAPGRSRKPRGIVHDALDPCLTDPNQPPQHARTRQRWWRRTGLNRRPPACKAGALPLSYAPSLAGACTRASARGLGGPGKI